MRYLEYSLLLMRMREPPIGITKDNDNAQMTTTQLPRCRVQVTDPSSSDYSNMVFPIGLALRKIVIALIQHADSTCCSECCTLLSSTPRPLFGECCRAGLVLVRCVRLLTNQLLQQSLMSSLSMASLSLQS